MGIDGGFCIETLIVGDIDGTCKPDKLIIECFVFFFEPNVIFDIPQLDVDRFQCREKVILVADIILITNTAKAFEFFANVFKFLGV